MSCELDRPSSISPEELDGICQLIYDAFDDQSLMLIKDAVLPHELDEWSLKGIKDDLGSLFTNTAARGGLWLARRPNPSSSTKRTPGGQGEIIGIVSCRQPKKSLPPKEGQKPETSSSPALPGGVPLAENSTQDGKESDEVKKRREWRKHVHDPFIDRLFDKAFGKPAAPAVHITFIAVSPKAQKMGIGSALMDKAWTLAQDHQVGVTLLTDTPANMSWYTYLGYSVNATDEEEVAGQMVRFWAMSKGVVAS